MKDNKFIIGVIVFSVIAIAGGAYVSKNMGKGSEVTVSEGARASVTERSFAWGNIGINDGNVEKTFEIKNEGTGPLVLSNVTTSCMCTTAQLSLGDKISPVFGMHSKSSYSLEVPPGESANLKVIFDPAFHGPSGIGPIDREILVSTNDPSNKELSFKLTALVTK